MEEVLLKIGEFFHNDTLIANAGVIAMVLVYVVNSLVTIAKNRRTVKVKVDNEETNRKLEALDNRCEALEKQNKQLKDMLIVMVRYSRLSDEAKTKIEDIYEGEEDVDMEVPQEEEPVVVPNRTVIQRLSQELDN